MFSKLRVLHCRNFLRTSLAVSVATNPYTRPLFGHLQGKTAYNQPQITVGLENWQGHQNNMFVPGQGELSSKHQRAQVRSSAKVTAYSGSIEGRTSTIDRHKPSLAYHTNDVDVSWIRPSFFTSARDNDTLISKPRSSRVARDKFCISDTFAPHATQENPVLLRSPQPCDKIRGSMLLLSCFSSHHLRQAVGNWGDKSASLQIVLLKACTFSSCPIVRGMH